MLTGRRRLFEGPLSFFPLCLFLSSDNGEWKGRKHDWNCRTLALSRRGSTTTTTNGTPTRNERTDDADADGRQTGGGNRAHAREHGPPFGRPPSDLPSVRPSVRSDERVVPRQKEKEGHPKEMLSTARFDLTLDLSIRIHLSLSSAPRTRSAFN